jgi:SAM-dependent methyltransferase
MTVGAHEEDSREDNAAVRLQCPACGSRIPDVDIGVGGPLQVVCLGCGFVMTEANGILRALTPASKTRFEQFVRDYEVVREKEGWGSQTPDYYLALPFKDLTNRHDWIWRIRARTLLYLQNHLLPRLGCTHSSGCRILDIGAGNGWLSYRLAKRGYDPVAVDLLDNDIDGLGAARHYLADLPRSFPRFQADMDHLPFDSGQFDIAIFNASFHYSSDYGRTLKEVLRCVRRPGIVIVADSPFYWHEESGKQMLEERRATFERQFGVSSDSSESRDYLTQSVLNELAESLAIQWDVCKPWYGLSWALRPLKARLLHRREPSKFYLWWFKVEK